MKQTIYLYAMLWLCRKLFPYVSIYAPGENVEGIVMATKEGYIDRVIEIMDSCK